MPDGTPTNGTATKSSNVSDATNISNTLLLRKKFAKKGRTISSTITQGYNESLANGSQYTDQLFYNFGVLTKDSILDQQNKRKGSTNSYSANVVYTEPITKKSLLEFNAFLNRNNSATSKKVYDRNAGNNQYDLLNNRLTNEFSSEYTYAGGGMNYRLNQKKYNFSTGFSLQDAMLNGVNTSVNTKIKQEFKDVLPSAMFQYNFSQTQNFNFNYRTSTNQPSLTQLQPVLDQSNINNQTIGNPNLKRTYNHNINLRYFSTKVLAQRNFFALLNAQIANNSIVNYDSILPTRQTLSKPVNVNGVYRINGSVNYGFAIKKIYSRLNFVWLNLRLKFVIWSNSFLLKSKLRKLEGLKYNELKLNIKKAIKEIPKEIRSLINLQHLDLYNNQLQGVDKVFNFSHRLDNHMKVQKIQKEDENYWLLNSFYVNDTYFLTFSGYNGSNYKNYYSKDLISWKEIPKPNNLAIASYEGIKYYNNSIFLFTWDTKNKSIAYYSSDFGKNWKELIGLHYKFSDGFGNASIQNIMIFNNKIYYENLITPYAPSIYDIEKKTTTSISSQYPFIKYPKIKDDYIYFTSKNKIWIYKNDSISELKIDYSKFKNIEDALITENYIVIDGIKSLVTNGLSEKEKNKYLAIDKESKYVQAKTITKEDSSNSNGIVTNNYNQNNSNKKQFDCVEINLSNKKPTKSMANLFMAKVNDDNSIKKIICENNGQVYEILDKNLFRIGYKIIERKENKIKNLYIFDNNGLLYVHHLYEYSEGNTYIYHYNYTGMVISLEVNNKYNNYQASMKEGVTKEKALNNYLNRNNIKVVSPSQNKSYSSDGSKCNNCRLGLYVRGTCSQCGAVSQERLYESLSKRPNCQACRGMRYIKGFNGMRLCPICRGTGKQTY